MTHDRETLAQFGGGTAYPYGTGYCWEDASFANSGNPCTNCKASVMAYGFVCKTSTNTCSNCVPSPFFSNPNVIYVGNPTGTVNDDNARVLEERLSIVTNWRSSLTTDGIIFSATPSTLATGSCAEVTIDGWRLGSGSDITSVTLAGVEVEAILSQTQDSVTVRSSSATSTGTGDVVVTSSGGVVTTLTDGVTYMSSGGATGTCATVATPTATPTSEPTEPCPPGWSRYAPSGKCYNLGPSNLQPSQCQAHCASHPYGATMLCIENAGENAYIFSLTQAVHHTGFGKTYVGYTRPSGNTPSDFTWTEVNPNCPSTYTRWNSGEPQSNEYIAVLWSDSNWHDVPSNYGSIYTYCGCEVAQAQRKLILLKRFNAHISRISII